MRWAILLVAILPATGCLGPSLERFENTLVYQPVCTLPDEIPSSKPLPKTPDDFEDATIDLGLQPRNVSTYDGEGKITGSQIFNFNMNLHGWFAEAKNPRAVVLYCHGNAGNVENCAEALRIFRDKLHVSILAFDYRSYGQSSSIKPTEDGLYTDARAARIWLAVHAKVPEKDIILCGYSLGGGVAVELAAKDGARGLILDRTFTSIPDVGESFVPVLPIQWLMVNRYESLSKIKNYHGPLLQFHGDKDSVVPYELGQKLFAAANEPKQFVRIPGGDHLDPWAGWQIEALNEFFDQLNGVAADASAKRR